MKVTRLVAGVVAAAILGNGCSNHGLKPGVTFEASVIAMGEGGTATPQGPQTRVESALVQDVREIANDGIVFTLAIRKTEHEKATFEITFPDKTSQLVRIKDGETKDVLPKGQKHGIRIAVFECR
jgi:hypothetical protein